MRIGKYETSENGNVGTAISFLLIGLGVGAALGLLLAPKAGKQLRRDMRRSYEDALETISEWSDEAKERFDEAIEKGADFTEEFRGSSFKVFKGTVDNDGVVKAINAKGLACATQGQLEASRSRPSGPRGKRARTRSWRAPRCSEPRRRRMPSGRSGAAAP